MRIIEGEVFHLIKKCECGSHNWKVDMVFQSVTSIICTECNNYTFIENYKLEKLKESDCVIFKKDGNEKPETSSSITNNLDKKSEKVVLVNNNSDGKPEVVKRIIDEKPEHTIVLTNKNEEKPEKPISISNDFVIPGNALTCLFDNSVLKKTAQITNKSNLMQRNIDIYECPYCRRRYVNYERSMDAQIIDINNQHFINRSKSNPSLRIFKDDAHYDFMKNTLGYKKKGCVITEIIPKKCIRKRCQVRLFRRLITCTTQNKKHTIVLDTCPLCATNYVSQKKFDELKENNYYQVTFKDEYFLSKKQELEDKYTYRNISLKEKRELKKQREKEREEKSKQLDRIRQETAEVMPKTNLCYVYDTKMKMINSCKKCLYSNVLESYFEYYNKKGKKVKLVTKRCLNCGAHLISRGLYKSNPGAFKTVSIEKPNNTNSNVFINIVSDEIKDSTVNNSATDGAIQVKASPVHKVHEKNNTISIDNIDIHDFVVKSNIFKCMYKDHEIEEIFAAVRIINRRGEILEKKVPAGYCHACKIYFILDSMYERLKASGIILCRITDEKSYMNRSVSSNGMELAQESILKQFGYNVSQNDDLSDVQRQRLLSEIVDYRILTPSKIISYLDFFINQRKSNPKYEIAISKWVKDRQFISSYGYDGARNVKVRSIKTRN